MPRPATLVDFILSAIDDEKQIAAAAGHGAMGEDSWRAMRGELSGGWIEVSIPEENVRQSYDLSHIRVFNPDRIKREWGIKIELVKVEAERSGGDSDLLRRIAAEYSRSPWYKPEWAPATSD